MVWQAKIKEPSETLELFFSVFLSTFLSMISMGFFLRIGYVLGSAGLFYTLLIITLSALICFITAFSISSMISNIKIPKSSLYFLIARTFGIDVGFSISFPLFISQALSASFYMIALAEIFHHIFPLAPFKMVLWALFTFVCFSIVFLSSEIKLELFIFVLICLSLGSFWIKGSSALLNQVDFFKNEIDFWKYFAIFFPIITGIESLLSSLKVESSMAKPFAKALFLGLFSALPLYGLMIYQLFTYSPLNLLLSDPLCMKELSLFPPLLILTILTSGLFAAYSSIKAACATLQSLSEENLVFPQIKQKNFSLILTFILVSLGLYYGNLNSISTLMTLFFLFSYGMINLATALESWIENPSWRPQLSGHFSISLLGALLCFISSFMISAGFGFLSLGMTLVLYFYIKAKKQRPKWEDFRYSLLLLLSKSALYKLNSLESSSKNWRPNLLVFLGDPLLRKHLTEISADMTNKKGFLIFSSLLPSNCTCQEQEEKKIKLFLEKKEIPAIVKIKKTKSLLEGMKSQIEDIGLGNLAPNTIVLGATYKPEKFQLYSELIFFIHNSEKNLILIKESTKAPLTKNARKRIDLWWGGLQRTNSDLMIILSYLLTKSGQWKGALTTLKTTAKDEQEKKEKEEKLKAFLKKSRIDLQTEVIIHPHGDIFTTIKTSSCFADLLFLGIKPPEKSESIPSYSRYYQKMIEKTEEFPVIAFVLGSEKIDFSKILD